MALTEKIAALMTQLTTLTEVLPELFKRGARKVVEEDYITVPANGVVDYDLVALLGDEVGKYNTKQAAITVLVTDTESGSPTEGYYINAEAVVTFGIKEETKVRIANRFAGAVDLYVRIEVPRSTV